MDDDKWSLEDVRMETTPLGSQFQITLYVMNVYLSEPRVQKSVVSSGSSPPPIFELRKWWKIVRLRFYMKVLSCVITHKFSKKCQVKIFNMMEHNGTKEVYRVLKILKLKDLIVQKLGTSWQGSHRLTNI